MCHPANRSEIRERMLLVLIAVPVVGVLMGGAYALPAMWVSRGKEPYLTILLCACLALPVLAVGHILRTHHQWLMAHWLLSVLLLLARRASGPLNGSVERFGIVNALAILLAFVGGMLARAGVLPAVPL